MMGRRLTTRSYKPNRDEVNKEEGGWDDGGSCSHFAGRSAALKRVIEGGWVTSCTKYLMSVVIEFWPFHRIVFPRLEYSNGGRGDEAVTGVLRSFT